MKQLVMKVEKFFNVFVNCENFTILSGHINCKSLKKGEMVEIHTATDVLKTCIENIKYDDTNVKEITYGLECELAFSGVSYMDFTVSKYGERGVAEGVMILKEVPDEKVAEERSEFDSEGNRPKPNFLFLHGPD